ncbi:hypothetical protein [Legionella erythra]|nr:hypothetical protein [Legionella erythra]
MMINLSVKKNENKIEIRIDYLRTQGIFFEENPDTFNLDTINAKTSSLSQLIEELTSPSAWTFCPMAGQALVKNQIQLKMVEGTLFYSLLNEAGDRVDGSIAKDELKSMLHADCNSLLPNGNDLSPLQPHFSRLMNYMALKHLGGFYFFKALPRLTGEAISMRSVPAQEFLARPLSYDRKNKAKEQPYTWSTVIYDIPTENPEAALRLIAFFQVYVKTRVHVVRQYSVAERLKDKKFGALAPNQIFGDAKAQAAQPPIQPIHAFIEAVLEIMQPLPHYATLFKHLQTVYRYANDWALLCENEDELRTRDLLSERVFNEEAIRLVLDFKSPSFLYDENLPLDVRQSRFDQMIMAYEQAGLLRELISFVEGLNGVAVTQFLKERTHLKKALDGAVIEWDSEVANSTEVRFLSGSTFSLSEGRMRVVNHGANPYYLVYKTAENAALLTPEVSFLLKELLLCEAEEGDFHQGIVFTEAASEQLMNQGLHFNAQYIEQRVAKYRLEQQETALAKNMLLARTVLSEQDKQSIASLSALGLHASATKGKSESKTEWSNSLKSSSEETTCACKLL